MELMALANEKTQEKELEGKDALKVDLYFWLQALVMVLVAGIIGMVLVRGIPHISWKFLSTTVSPDSYLI